MNAQQQAVVRTDLFRILYDLFNIKHKCYDDDDDEVLLKMTLLKYDSRFIELQS